MAAGRPVVVTDVGGSREAVVEGETGYIIPAGDDEGMADRISSFFAIRNAHALWVKPGSKKSLRIFHARRNSSGHSRYTNPCWLSRRSTSRPAAPGMRQERA